MKKMNILVATLGNWQLIPEIIGFTNPHVLNFYALHPQLEHIEKLRQRNHIKPVRELWLITTDQRNKQENSVKKTVAWYRSIKKADFTIKFFILENVADIRD